MGLHTATGLIRWVKSAEAKTLYAGRLNIGPRLILGFVFIILSMLAADVVILWQFQVVRTQAGRLNDIDQKLVAVLRVHTSMLAFHDRLDGLADAEDADRVLIEAGPLRTAVLEDIHRATSALSLPPLGPRRDPTILPTLHVIQSALPSQLEAITTLATSGDWRAVHLRLTNQVRPLEYLASALVEKVEHAASEQQAETVLNIRRVRRLVFWVVPLTAVFTLLIAATLGLTITRSITQPLARLVEGSKALARGEFQHQVSVSGKDELAHLGQVFNDTARRLRDLYATLQQSEDRLRLVIDTIPAHVWSTRADGSVDFVNRRFLETTGLTMEHALGSDWASVVHPDDLARYADKWRSALAAGEPTESEVRLRRPDGNYRWWLTRAVPLRDELGNIVKWYGTAIDIEDRKRADEERERLRQVQADLAHLSRVTTMGELTASLAHEIKQPIAAAVTNARTCLRWLGRDQPDVPEAREAAARIIKDVTRASDIISSISLLFKKGALHRELVDVNELIREMIVLLRSEANRHSISIRIELAEGLPKVMADRVQLQQVFMNLMLNGIDAMKETTGGGELIIESHGGRLWATVVPGSGATFQFTLPATVAAHA